MERIEFTKEMKKDYTILFPDMLPIHFELMEKIFASNGYKVERLTSDEGNDQIVREGLKYVHNDTCYPALLVIGQMIDALNSGKYDTNKTALMITQTGGGCRASNYIHLLRKALVKAGYGHVPVISLNVGGLEKNSGFSLTIPMIRQALASMAYGDILMLLSNQVEPYETEEGSCRTVVYSWVQKLSSLFMRKKGYNLGNIRKYMKQIAADFAAIPVIKRDKVKVGIVGEIYVKYAALGNNGLERFLRGIGCEVMVPGVLGFLLYTTESRLNDKKLYGSGSIIELMVIKWFMGYFTKIEKEMLNAVSAYKRFVAPSPFEKLKPLIEGVIGIGNKMGEGWLLTAEMIELVKLGYENIVCAQPFGCLPNHICGKGMMKRIKELYSNANIVPIDYDPGATRVNQENRIKLMLAVAGEQKQTVNV